MARQLASFDRLSLTSLYQELVTINQCLLNALGAGHESIERVLAIASGCGFEGKLTGAGGGGCVIIHLPSGLFHRRMQFTLMHSH